MRLDDVARWVTFRRDERSAEIAGRVAFRAAGDDGKAEYGSDSAAHAGCGLVPSALFDLPQGFKDLGRLELRYRAFAELLVGEVEQPLLLL